MGRGGPALPVPPPLLASPTPRSMPSRMCPGPTGALRTPWLCLMLMGSWVADPAHSCCALSHPKCRPRPRRCRVGGRAGWESEDILLLFLVSPSPPTLPLPLGSWAAEGRSEAARRPGAPRGFEREGTKGRARLGAGLELEEGGGRSEGEGAERRGEGAREQGPPAREARGGAARRSMGEAGEEFQSLERS